MNIAKIIDALEQTDQLDAGQLVNSTTGNRCALGQLLHVAGKTNEEIAELSCAQQYHELFDGLFEREYGMLLKDVGLVLYNNDYGSSKFMNESLKARHIRVTEHWKKELVKCLISESSSPVEVDSQVCADVSTAPLHSQQKVLV